MKPNFLSEQFWNSTTYEANKWLSTDWTFGSGDFTTVYLQNISATPCSPVTITTHTNTSGTINNLTGLTSLTVHGSTGAPPAVLLSGNSASDYAYLLKSVRKLARNEGFAFQVLTNDLEFAGLFPYLCVYFGGNYCLLLGSGGRCELWKNKPEDDTDPAADTWERVQVMDYSSSLDPENNNALSVMVIPFSERYLGFYIGPGLGSSEWAGQNGSQDTSPTRRYLVEVKEEREYDTGTGTDDHDDDGLWKITPEDHVVIAAPKLAQFALGFYEIRYPSEQTLYLAPENLGQLYTAKPSWTSNGSINRGSVTFDTVNIDGTAWDFATDTEMVAKIVANSGNGITSESASGEKVYSPEVYWASAKIAPVIEPVDRSAIEEDLADLVQIFSVNQRIDEPSYMDLTTVPDESFYSLARKHSQPIRLSLTDDIDGTDYTLFEGYGQRTISKFYPTMTQLTIPAGDGWMVLEDQKVWDSRPFDGETVVSALQHFLNTAGYPDEKIYATDEVQSVYLREPARPQDYTFRANQGDSCADMCRRILSAGDDVRLRQGWASTGLTSLGGTALTETDWVWIIEHRPVYTSSTQIDAKFWLRKPLGETWNGEDDRFNDAVPDLKAWEAEPDIEGPQYTKYFIDCPDSAGKDATRHSIQTLRNTAAIETAAHRDYCGRVKHGHLNAATHGARTKQDLTPIARDHERDYMHAVEYLTIRGEWRPWLIPDTFVEFYAVNTITNLVEKWGVYRILDISYTVSYDRDASQLAMVEAIYTMQWEHDGDEYTDPNDVEE